MKNKNIADEQLNQNIRIAELETSNGVLLEKVKLLKIQLESQSQFQHATRSHQSRSASLSRSRTNLQSSRNFHSTLILKTPDHTRHTSTRSYDFIYHQLNVLQKEFENVKDQHRNRISELEDQLKKKESLGSPTELKAELNENIELIKLKRLSKKQTAQILSLQSQLEIANAEMKQLQTSLTKIDTSKDDLHNDLLKEKTEIVKLNSEVLTLKENNKLLEEQLNDLQIEKETLKEHNANMLKLSLQNENDTKDLRLIKELEHNLKRELIAKKELLSKIEEMELVNEKLKNDIIKNTLVTNELQNNNSAMQIELEDARKKLKLYHLSKNVKNYVEMEDKSVMTLSTDSPETKTPMFEETSFASIIDSKSDVAPDLKIQYLKITRELSQCKELLRVQCSLNNKYKLEIEDLQKMFQKSEKSASEHLHHFQLVLQHHDEQLSQIAEEQFNKELNTFLDQLKNTGTTRKLNNFQNYIDVVDKLLNGYITCFESMSSKMKMSFDKKDVTIQAIVDQLEKSVQAEMNLNSKSIVDGKELEAEEFSQKEALVPSENLLFMSFELRIVKANFIFFSNHLLKSTDNNPKVFLTWNFLEDSEHQAYTPTISVKEGIFDCSCQYEGPWSKFLFLYLKEHGIRVEIHLVQGDISVRLAETIIPTSSALDHPNSFQNFCSKFKNDNVEGEVTGNFLLKCDPNLLSTFV